MEFEHLQTFPPPKRRLNDEFSFPPPKAKATDNLEAKEEIIPKLASAKKSIKEEDQDRERNDSVPSDQNDVPVLIPKFAFAKKAVQKDHESKQNDQQNQPILEIVQFASSREIQVDEYEDVIKEEEPKHVKEDMPKPVIEKKVENTENVQFASSREVEADEDEEMIVEEKTVVEKKGKKTEKKKSVKKKKTPKIKPPPAFDPKEVERKENSGPESDSEREYISSNSESDLFEDMNKATSRRLSADTADADTEGTHVLYNQEIFFEPHLTLEDSALDKVRWDLNLKLDIGIPVVPTKSFKRETMDPSKKKQRTSKEDSDEEIEMPPLAKRDLKGVKNFLLPYDIYFQIRYEAILDLYRKNNPDNFSLPFPFIKTIKSIYSADVPKTFELHEPCECTKSCGSKCMSRLMSVECTKKTCSLGAMCSNRVISKRQWVQCKVQKAGKKGWGLFLNEDVKKGQFILEYVGEVISSTECEYRLKTHYANEKNFYMLTLDATSVIDATRIGGIGRFTNHSCDPNCETQKWTVEGRARVGIFALKDLSAGQEITFDYRFERFGGKKEECHCGASNCRGFLGAKAPSKNSKNKVVSKKVSVPKSTAASSSAEDQLSSGTGVLQSLSGPSVSDVSSLPYLSRNLELGIRSRQQLLSRYHQVK